ncbi:hypothetical protein [Candidatus Uabimicrobium sp. HlEnr_7]|uniref:hypothetical protein n=1 Tax=Candidatus Uabimicrobium helgolandensis TaxID=3095367 RepID=UPI003558361C
MFIKLKNKKGSALILVMTLVILTTSLLYGLLTLSVFNARKSDQSINKQALLFHAQSGLDFLKAIVEEQVDQQNDLEFLENWADATEDDDEPYLTFRPLGNNQFQFVALNSNGTINTTGNIQRFLVIGEGADSAQIYLSIKETENDDWYRLEARAWKNNRETVIMSMTSLKGKEISATEFARFVGQGSLSPNSPSAYYDGDLHVGGVLSHMTTNNSFSGSNFNRYNGVVTVQNWVPPLQNNRIKRNLAGQIVGDTRGISPFNPAFSGGPLFLGHDNQPSVPNTILDGEDPAQIPENPVQQLTDSINSLGSSLPSDDRNIKFDYLADDSDSLQTKSEKSDLWRLFSEGQSGTDVKMFDRNGDEFTFSDLTPSSKDQVQPKDSTEEVQQGTELLSNDDLITSTIKLDVIDQDLKADIAVTYRTRAGSSSRFSHVTVKTTQSVKNDTTFFTRGNSNIRGFYDRRLSVVATNVSNVLGPVIAVNSDGDKRFGVTEVDSSGSPAGGVDSPLNFHDPIDSSVRERHWGGRIEGNQRFGYIDKFEAGQEGDFTYWEPSQIEGESVVPALALVAQEQILLRQPEFFTQDVDDFEKYAQNPEYHVAFIVANGEVHSHNASDINDHPITPSANNRTGINRWNFGVQGTSLTRRNLAMSGTLVTRGGCSLGNTTKARIIAYDKSFQTNVPPNVPLLETPGKNVVFGAWAVLMNFRQNEDDSKDLGVNIDGVSENE